MIDIDDKIVNILYTNWRGITSVRTIKPERIVWKSTEWHKEPQWLLDAFDIDRDAFRTFAMKDIKSWWVEDGRV